MLVGICITSGVYKVNEMLVLCAFIRKFIVLLALLFFISYKYISGLICLGGSFWSTEMSEATF